MEPWKEKARYLFPEFGSDMDDPDYSIYSLMTDLLGATHDAHRRDDDQYLRSAYGYVEWCFHQEEKELWNAAGVGFYECLFTDINIGEKIVPWLSPAVIPDLRNLFGAVFGQEVLHSVDELIANCTEWRYRENIYHTGLIDKI